MSKKKPDLKTAESDDINVEDRVDTVENAVIEMDSKVLHLDMKVEGLVANIDVIGDNIRKMLEMQQGPSAIRRPLEADEQDMGEDYVATMGLDDDDSPIILRPGPGALDDPIMQNKLKLEAFMQEPVTVHIQTTSEENAPQVFEISVNNKRVVFRRGEQKTVRRYIVEGLARAKPIHFDNEEFINKEGVSDVRWPSRRGLRYPFAVIEDRNPVGAKWLKSVLVQP